ncbi:unnamed protein product, partial [Symbiodinium necroappetens]
AQATLGHARKRAQDVRQNSRKFWLQQQLRSLRSAGRTAAGRLRIARILAELQQKGLLVSAQDSSAAIQALGSAGWWQEALALFEVALRLNSRGAGTGGTTPPMVDVRMYNAAIAALRSSPFRWQQAFALVHAMSVSQLQPDIATMNSAATALKGELLWKQTLSAYAAATNQGVCMDKVGTNILMAAMVAVDCRWSLGMESLRFALLQQLQPDVCSLGCVLGILSSQSHWARSCWQLRAAAAAALDMDTIVLNSALSSTEEVSHWAAGLSLLTTTLRHELRTDAISFNAVLAAASKQGVWWHGLQYLEWLHQLGEPTLVSYNSLLVYADGDGRRWETAVQILDDMTADCCSGKAREFLPDVVTVSSVGNMLQAFAQWEQAMLLANQPHEGSDGATLPTATRSIPFTSNLAPRKRRNCLQYLQGQALSKEKVNTMAATSQASDAEHPCCEKYFTLLFFFATGQVAPELNQRHNANSFFGALGDRNK